MISSLNSSLTPFLLFSTLETVEGDTPNCAAISRMVIGRHLFFCFFHYIVGSRDSQCIVKSLVNKKQAKYRDYGMISEERENAVKKQKSVDKTKC